jgi:radical SAM protein with 4Fe4S-binding SPASM domain
MFKKKHVPYSTVIELTLRCNMRCIHCGSAAGTHRKNELTHNEWVTVFNDLASLNGRLVTFMGGEPFLRPDWYELAEAVNNTGMKVIFMSNGYCINDKAIEQIRKIEPYTVAISIDGATAQTHDTIRGLPGSFQRCQEVITALRNADLPTTVVTTVHKLNFKELPQMRDFLIHRNIAWQIQIADPIGRFPKDLHLSPEEFYAVGLFIGSTRQQYSIKEMPVTGAHCVGYYSQMLPNVTLAPKWTGCQAGLTALGIQSDGGVKGCLSLSSEFVEGNIREKSLIDIWNDPAFCSYTRQFTTQDLTGECTGCKFAKDCQGGCTAVSTACTGKAHGDPFCFYHIEKEKCKETTSLTR